MKKYGKILQIDNDFQVVPGLEIFDKLPPGMYVVKATQQGEIYFTKMSANHDGLIDLPNTEYDYVVKEIENFMTPETKKKFADNDFIYKRAALLFGKAGTGKTSIINRVTGKVIKDSGVVLFSPNPKLLEEAFKILDSLQPETRTMVIFEELDQLIDQYETSLLNLLDGEIQKSNVIFMATTNHIDKIPARIRRPGRFSSIVEVGFPSEETRLFYLNKKLGGHSGLKLWAKKTEGFSIDELKETVLAVVCLGQDLDAVVKRIKANKDSADYADQEKEDDDNEENTFNIMTSNKRNGRR